MAKRIDVNKLLWLVCEYEQKKKKETDTNVYVQFVQEMAKEREYELIIYESEPAK